MSAILDYQIAIEDTFYPPSQDVQQWKDLVLTNQSSQNRDLTHSEITVRVVSEQESQSLNLQYRGKDKPTNVLSFPFEAPVQIEVDLLGDLVICAEVVKKESNIQNKPIAHHWAHMIIHGTLHLLGFDHVLERDAQQMESLEIALLTKLAIDDPYQDH